VKVFDYTRCPSGVLVRRTLHWFVQHAVPKFDAKRDQIGIVVGLEFHAEPNGTLLAFPVIHWEGEATAAMTHPANVRPYRSTRKFPRVEISV
jgi:hypothetical protein